MEGGSAAPHNCGGKVRSSIGLGFGLVAICR
jgi:hypothetical protein